MVSARDFRELALVPVRGTVYVVSLPFVLTSKFLSILYLLFVSTPLSWAKRFTRRVEVTWEWTKCSAKSMLPWNYYSSSRCNSAIASRSLEHAVEAGHGEDYLSNAEALLGQRRPSSRSARRQRRKAIISHLIRALLEPASPSDSDDELERLNSEDRLYQLVRELINISKQETGPVRKTRNLPVLDLEALKANARDKEKLLAFITELDEYVAGMESGAPHEGESRGVCANTSETFCDPGSRRAEEELSHDLFSSPDPVSEDGIEVDSNEDEEKYADARLELPYPHPANSIRGLSPLIEVSSGLASAESTESVRNCADLETELNAALSRLSDMTSELEGAVQDEAVLVGARQVRVTETVTLEPDQQLESDKTCQPERIDSSFEDARDEFSSIPKIEPTLGIRDGHNKRDVASVRRSRPPSAHRVKNLQEPMDTSQDGDCDSEYTSDEEQREEGLPHSLSDQLMLLSPSSLQSHTSTATSAEDHKPEQDPSSSAVPLYASVNKEARRSVRANSDSTNGQQPTGASNGVQSPSLSKSGEPTPKESEPIRKAPEMSLFIRDRIPPWKQMRSRSNSNTEQANSQPSTPTQPPAPVHPLSAQSHTTTSTASREATPPPIPPYMPSLHPPATQSQSRIKNFQESSSSEEGKEGPDMYDKLPGMQMMPPIPSHAGQEGVYDTIPFHQQQQLLQAQRPQYLHERIAKKNESKSRPPVSHTPDLPPRNSKMRRTASADVMDQLAEDQDYSRLRRSGSERRSMSAADDDHRDTTILSSSKRRRSLSGERDRRAVSGGSQHQDHSGISRHRSSSEKHHPSSASTKHQSSSASTKHPSSSASGKPVEIGMANFLKILVSPSSSKTKSGASKDVAKVKSSASKDVARKKDVSRTKKEEGRHNRDEGKKHRHSTKSQSRDEDDDSIGIPRNESKTSLRSGVSMHSFESSGSVHDYFD